MGISLGDAILHIRGDRTGLESDLAGAGSGISSWLTRMGAVISGTAIFAAVASGLKRSIEETIAYATEVRQLSSVTGQTTEASSRLLQVFDDFNIGGGQVTTMLRTLASQGLSPTIETIAQLSDRYLALAPGVERATFLQQNFGRSGADLAIIMEQGSTAILARNAAVEGGLVLSQRDIDQAEALRQAEDGLGDTSKSVTTTIALFFIPALTAGAKALARNLVSTEDLDRATQNLNVTLAQNAPTYEAYVESVRRWGDANGELVLTQEEHDEMLRRTYPMYDATRGAMILMTPEAEAMAAAGRDMAGGWDEGARALRDFAGGAGGAGAQIDALAASVVSLTTAQLQQAELDALIQARDAAAAAGVDTRVFDEAINHLAITMGIATPITIGTRLAYQDLLAEFQRTGDVNAFTIAVQALIAQQNQLHDVDVTYTTHFVRTGTGIDKQFQHGGSFEVEGPSGTDRVPVAFMATAGERVAITPTGTEAREQQARGPQYPVTFNVYVNNRDDLQALEQSVMQIFRGV
jgi:hypothetical protein